MRILLIGGAGTLGTALSKALRERGHELVTVGRSSGDVHADTTDPAGIAHVFDEAGPLDAVVSAAGSVPYKRITDMTPDDESLDRYGDFFPRVSAGRSRRRSPGVRSLGRRRRDRKDLPPACVALTAGKQVSACESRIVEDWCRSPGNLQEEVWACRKPRP
jgi:hypothetical protein